MGRYAIIRDIKARQAVAQWEMTRCVYRYIARNATLPMRTRMAAQLALNRVPLEAVPSRIHNRCLETGRARGVINSFGISRIIFRKKALLGELPGVTKASW
ncbi:glucocorticoid receptor-like (DNA-binding domain) [Ramicandelaber brevisporus]|nr:glucocorticoid receptor-like (DNA-binding domain) [Ramicandelaber brevisporus]